MNGRGPDDPPHGPAVAADDLHRLTQDWITIWQSELAALAVDREVLESWQVVAGLWANAVTAWAADGPGSRSAKAAVAPDDADGAPRRARPAAAARAAASSPAPDPRDAEIERLARRVAELERRLGRLEGNVGPGRR